MLTQQILGRLQHQFLTEIEDMLPSRYWAVTQRGVYFFRPSQSLYEVRFYDLATRKVSIITVVPHSLPRARLLTVSPDDHWLVYSQMDEVGSDIMMLTGLR